MSEQRFASSKRRRAYKRSFDYEEALERFLAGESQAALAKAYGVSVDGLRYGLDRARRDEERGMRRLGADEMLEALGPGKDRCPTCGGIKGINAALCVTCFRVSRLVPMSVELVPGEERVRLVNVRLGSVVQYEERWGVVEGYAGPRKRIIHFWDDPAELVPARAIVTVAPSYRVFADGEEQEPELVA